MLYCNYLKFCQKNCQVRNALYEPTQNQAKIDTEQHQREHDDILKTDF